MKPLIVWDADDTLWFVEPLYDEARAEARALVEAIGVDGEAWEQLQRSIDVNNVARFGVSKQRFPTSCLEAFDQLSNDASTRVKIRHVALQVFWRQAPLAEGAADALEVAGHFARQWLLTKGDHEVQIGRVNHSGLVDAFEHSKSSHPHAFALVTRRSARTRSARRPGSRLDDLQLPTSAPRRHLQGTLQSCP